MAGGREGRVGMRVFLRNAASGVDFYDGVLFSVVFYRTAGFDFAVLDSFVEDQPCGCVVCYDGIFEAFFAAAVQAICLFGKRAGEEAIFDQNAVGGVKMDAVAEGLHIDFAADERGVVGSVD